MSELTGITRYRVLYRLFRKPVLVLQIKVYEAAFTSIAPADGYWPETTVQVPSHTYWRDAKPEELQEILQNQGKS